MQQIYFLILFSTWDWNSWNFYKVLFLYLMKYIQLFLE